MKILLMLLLIVCAAACAQESVTVRVKNHASFDRRETVEVPMDALRARLGLAAGELPLVKGKEGSLTAQRIDGAGGGVLLFQSGFGAEEEKEFTVTKASPAAPLVSSPVEAKYILPRKDVAWENDRIAFRIYGGPLAGNVRNGLDVWVKRVTTQVIDKWYAGDSLKGKARISYHVDHGEGADMFDVGTSLGAGGCAVLLDGVLCQPGLFASQRITASGPVRAEFTVTYNVDSCGTPFTVEQKYALDAGEELNRIDVAFKDVGRPFQVVTGLVRRKNTTDTAGAGGTWAALWGLVNADSANGSLGTGIVLPQGGELKETADHAMLVAPPGDKLTYYAGAGWTRSGNFPTEASWTDYLARYVERLRSPLELTVLP